MVSVLPVRITRKREVVRCSICDKSTKTDEMEVTSNMPMLEVIIFSGLVGENKYQIYGGQ